MNELITTRTFSTALFGFNKQQVHQCLNALDQQMGDLRDQIETLTTQKANMESEKQKDGLKIYNLEKQIAEYQEKDKNAFASSKEIIENAQKQADSIIAKAKADAAEIIAKAKEEAAKVKPAPQPAPEIKVEPVKEEPKVTPEIKVEPIVTEAPKAEPEIKVEPVVTEAPKAEPVKEEPKQAADVEFDEFGDEILLGGEVEDKEFAGPLIGNEDDEEAGFEFL